MIGEAGMGEKNLAVGALPHAVGVRTAVLQKTKDLRDPVSPQVRTGRGEDPAHGGPTLARPPTALSWLAYLSQQG